MNYETFILWCIAAAAGIERIHASVKHRKSKERLRAADTAKLEAEKKTAEAEAERFRADAENIVGRTFHEAMRGMGEELARVRGVCADYEARDRRRDKEIKGLKAQNEGQERVIQGNQKEIAELRRSQADLTTAHRTCEEKHTELGMRVESQATHILQLEATVSELRTGTSRPLGGS